MALSRVKAMMMNEMVVVERPVAAARRLPGVAAAHLLVGLVWLGIGMSIGIAMAAGHDFLLRPVHAHVNLLGWVTNALFGLFHWQRRRVVPRDWVAFGLFNLGSAAMATGLTAILNGAEGMGPVMLAGSVGIVGGVVLFAVSVVAAVRDRGGHCG